MALFLQLAELAEQMAATASRLKKRAAIAEVIAAIHAAEPASEDASLFALYLAGEPFAESDSRKLSIGGALLSKAILKVSDASDAALTAAYRRHGDLGGAAFDLLAGRAATESGSVSRPLTLTDAADGFAAMATARTTGIRSELIEGLLGRASALEAKYLVKLMLGDMRIGVKQSLVEEAIAQAASTPNISATPAEVRHAVMLEADLGSAVRHAFAGTLSEARMRLFHPLGFMLASPVDSPEEAAARFQQSASNSVEHGSIHAFLEDKYDGMRAQLHCGDASQPGRVAIFSRNREDITESFPELVEAFAHVDPGVDGPLIFDGEILAWNFAMAPVVPRLQDETLGRSLPKPDDDDVVPQGDAISLPRALPFAILGERIGRKRISNELRVRVPVVFMAFDLLYANGELTLNMPLHARRQRLEAITQRLCKCVVSPLRLDVHSGAAQATLFPRMPGELEYGAGLQRLIVSPSRLVESVEEIDVAYAAARARSNEGVMIKGTDSVYQPGRRGLAWLKLKRELATLDVVITGAEYGHGRRAGSLSDYTFAVREAGSGELLNVGKAYSGVTDVEIAELTEFLKAHTLEDQGHFRMVEPLIVLEVAFNNIMRSTRHASGFALRFPRIVRLRPDKPVGEIDTLERVEEIYQSQVDKPIEKGGE